MSKLSLLSRTAAVAGLFAFAAFPALADATQPAAPVVPAPAAVTAPVAPTATVAPDVKADTSAKANVKADTKAGTKTGDTHSSTKPDPTSQIDQKSKDGKQSQNTKAAGGKHVASLHQHHATSSAKPPNTAAKPETTKQ